VQDHCEAIGAVLEKGEAGEIYNIAAGNEITTMAIAQKVIALLNKPESLVTFIENHHGHATRYSVDSTKTRNTLGWQPQHSFESSLEPTIQWYLEHERWWIPFVTEMVLHLHLEDSGFR
jgi:dTDP-glucose 4,6-dehydratase